MIEHVMWTSCEWQTMRRRHSSITSHVLSALGKASVGLWVLLCWINTTQHELRDSSHDFFWIVAKQIQTKQVLLYKCLSRPRPRSGQNSTRRGTGITSSFKVRASGKPAWVQADIALEIVPLKRNFDFWFILHSRHNMNLKKIHFHISDSDNQLYQQWDGLSGIAVQFEEFFNVFHWGWGQFAAYYSHYIGLIFTTNSWSGFETLQERQNSESAALGFRKIWKFRERYWDIIYIYIDILGWYPRCNDL